MDRIRLLQNPVMEYDWGSGTVLQELLDLPGRADRPMAELWMGAHPRAPSLVCGAGEPRPLDRLTAEYPATLLGGTTARRFGNRFPFLFKVLAVEHPLSIQVHPGRKQAREGFAAEEKLGMASDDSRRNFKDSHHKPELLCAWTPFTALAGFRPVDEILRLGALLASDILQAILDRLRAAPGPDGVQGLLAALLNQPAEQRRAIVATAVERAHRHADTDPGFKWVGRLHAHYPDDVGVLAPVMLNIVELQPGEAIFIPPGQLHAYLRGVGLELMAGSDNVIRGGLTPKHVDVRMLLKLGAFAGAPVAPLCPKVAAPSEMTYETPTEEFRLSRIDLTQPYNARKRGGVEILLCMQGRARIHPAGQDPLDLGRGQSVLIPAAAGGYRLTGEGVLFKAAAP